MQSILWPREGSEGAYRGYLLVDTAVPPVDRALIVQCAVEIPVIFHVFDLELVLV